MIAGELKNFFKNKKILVTGHTGFKGGWLVQMLNLWGADVIGASLKPHTLPSLFEALGLEKKIKNYFTDIRNFQEVKSIFEKERPEIVIHLAAQAIVKESFERPLDTVSTNTLGTTHIIQAIKESDSVKSAVIITTDKVYKNNEWIYPYREIDELGGKDLYSASKAAADIIVRAYLDSFFTGKKDDKVLVAIARAGNVIGGGDWSKHRVVPDLIRAVYENNENMTIRSPKAIRPWQHVFEPLSGYLLLAKKLYEKDSSATGVWNFGPENESFIDVEELIKRAIAIMGAGAYKVEPDLSQHESVLLKLDITKVKTLLGWSPKLNLDESLKFTFEWYKNFYDKTVPVEEFTNAQIKKYFE